MDRRNVLAGIGVVAVAPDVAQTRSRHEISNIIFDKANSLIMLSSHIGATVYNLKTQSNNLTSDQIAQLTFLQEKCRADLTDITNDLFKIVGELQR